MLGRKVCGSQGKLLEPFTQEVNEFLAQMSSKHDWNAERAQLQQALDSLNGVSAEVLQKAGADENIISAVAVEYLHLVGYVCYAYLWLRMAAVAEQKQADKPYLGAKIKTAKFYFARILPRVNALVAAIKDGSESLYLHDEDEF